MSAPEAGMSGPPATPTAAAPAGVELCIGSADIVELACRRGRAADLRALGESRGQALPEFGRVIAGGGRLALCVRPGRWLLLQPRRDATGTASEWSAACAGLGSVVDLSSAFALLRLRGPMAVELLDRHCRLDLRREHFGVGKAAASLMAQVPIIIAARPRSLLLATPASTARHFREWLVAAGRPFGLGQLREATTEDLLGD